MADPRQPVGEHLVYLNGEIVAGNSARISIADYGVLYGLGFFETFRTSGGRPHLWQLHRRRLLEACATARIEVPPHFLIRDEKRLCEIIGMQLTERGGADAVFRYTVSAGQAAPAGRASYEQPVEWMAARALPPPFPERGVTLRVLQLTRDSGEWVPRPKSLNYSNAILGADELRRRTAGADEEGLFLARDGGWVVETPRQNLAWIARGQWWFPDPMLGAVAGTCLQWLRDLNPGARPTRAPLEELAGAEAVVLLNAVRGVTPVHTLRDAQDHARLAHWDSASHPMVACARQAWDEALRETSLLL